MISENFSLLQWVSRIPFSAAPAVGPVYVCKRMQHKGELFLNLNFLSVVYKRRVV